MLAVRKGSCQKRLLRGRQAHGFQMVQQKTLFFLPTEQLFGGKRGNIRKLPEGITGKEEEAAFPKEGGEAFQRFYHIFRSVCKNDRQTGAGSMELHIPLKQRPQSFSRAEERLIFLEKKGLVDDQVFLRQYIFFQSKPSCAGGRRTSHPRKSVAAHWASLN